MKPTLHVILTTTLVSLIVLTVAAIGFNAHRNARFTAEDLTDQILVQTNRLVETRIDTLLLVANAQDRLNLDLLKSGLFETDRFSQLARYWTSVMKAHPRLSREGLALQESGEWSFIRRMPDGRLTIGELRRDPSTGKLGLKDYDVKDFPSRPFSQLSDAEHLDPRKQPWYQGAIQAGRQTWSKTFVMDDVEGYDHLPGLTCSAPILTEGGATKGVLTSSYDIISISEFLRALKVAQGGFAFIVEQSDEGKLQVIAHPDPKILIREARKDGRDPVKELVPVDELTDSRVRAFLNQIPRTPTHAILLGGNRISLDVDGIRYLGDYRPLKTPNAPDWLICVMMPEADVMARVSRNNQETALAGLAILAIATVVGLVVSAHVAGPLERVVAQAVRIGNFEIEPHPVARSYIREVDSLARTVEAAKTSLRSFGKYVPTDVIRQIFATGLEATLGGERRRLTISFCDLANFTTLAERLPPEELVIQMGDYFGRFSADIASANGTVDKYIGDAIMAFWNAPNPCENHAVDACLTALRNQATLLELHGEWKAKGKPELVARIGIMTGDVVVGNVGSPARLNYTAMGDAVNLASRLEGLGKTYGTHILIGDTTYEEAKGAVLARPVDRVSVKGKTEGMLIHELLCAREDDSPELRELADRAGRALQHYFNREWDQAILGFEEILSDRPVDGPAKVLLDRCQGFRRTPPPDDWDGVFHMTNK